MARTSSARLWALYKRHPYCWWCGIRVRKFPLEDGQPQPPDMATVDHLNTRNMYPDGRPNPRPGRVATPEATVLSSRQCNQERATAEQTGADWIPPLMRPLTDIRRLTSDFYALHW